MLLRELHRSPGNGHWRSTRLPTARHRREHCDRRARSGARA
jgi:hypothetical protein